LSTVVNLLGVHLLMSRKTLTGSYVVCIALDELNEFTTSSTYRFGTLNQ
jgi:hypothetical protein